MSSEFSCRRRAYLSLKSRKKGIAQEVKEWFWHGYELKKQNKPKPGKQRDTKHSNPKLALVLEDPHHAILHE